MGYHNDTPGPVVQDVWGDFILDVLKSLLRTGVVLGAFHMMRNVPLVAPDEVRVVANTTILTLRDTSEAPQICIV